jgi:hypothetical protein
MTRAEELLALADRVEKEEPSIALNEAVALSVGWRLCTDLGVHLWMPPDAAPCQAIPPNWLHSLAAAASLMPEGWWIEELTGRPDGSVYLLAVTEFTHAEGEAPDEKRARTAAALRAIASEACDE